MPWRTINKRDLFQGLKNWGSVFPRNNKLITILQSPPPNRKTRITKVPTPDATRVFLRDYLFFYPVIKSGEAVTQCAGEWLFITERVWAVVHLILKFFPCISSFLYNNMEAHPEIEETPAPNFVDTSWFFQELFWDILRYDQLLKHQNPCSPVSPD